MMHWDLGPHDHHHRPHHVTLRHGIEFGIPHHGADQQHDRVPRPLPVWVRMRVRRLTCLTRLAGRGS